MIIAEQITYAGSIYRLKDSEYGTVQQQDLHQLLKNWQWNLANDALHMAAKMLCCQFCQLNYAIQASEQQTNKQPHRSSVKFDS